MKAPDLSRENPTREKQNSNLCPDPAIPPSAPRLPHCFIQAGGRSSRMGEDKSWLPLEGRPLLEHLLAKAKSVADHIAIVISATNPQADRYRELAQQWNAETLDDLHGFRGPLGGIYTALTTCADEDSALILACDLPFVTTDFLQRLWQVHQATQSELTVPLDQRHRVQMLAGIYSAACRAPIARMLAWDELAADRLCLRVKTRLVAFSEYAHLPAASRLLINLNTPEQYQSLQPQGQFILVRDLRSANQDADDTDHADQS